MDYPIVTDVLHGSVRAKVSAAIAGDTLNEVNNDPVQRNKLIDNNNLLSGVVMISGSPVISSRKLIVRPNILNTTIDNSAGIRTTMVEAEFSNTLMESNYTSVAVKVSTPYVAASVEYSESSSYKSTETEKTVYSSSCYRFPQGRIDFNRPSSGSGSIVLSTEFTSEINTALAKSSLLEKREALYNIFNEYGHVFRNQVTIGGALSAHTQETFSRSENEDEVRQDIKVALEGELKGWGGSASAGHGNSKTTITTKQGKNLVTDYIVTGGDYTKIQNTAEWISTTNRPEYWRIIEVTSVIPVVDLLPEQQSSQVKRLLKPLLGKWVDVEKMQGFDHLPIAIYRPISIPSGWFWLGHTADSKKALLVKPTLPAKGGRNFVLSGGHANSSGVSTQLLADHAHYQFLATYFGQLDFTQNPGASIRALRPDIALPGQYTMYGDAIDTAVYVTRPISPLSPEDEGLDLQSTVRVKLVGMGNVPKPKWVLRKDAVLFDSGEE